MDLIITRPPTTAEPTREERLKKHAENHLAAATDDLIRSQRGMEEAVRLAHKYGLSQRRISETTGIVRSRIFRILTVPPLPDESAAPTDGGE